MSLRLIPVPLLVSAMPAYAAAAGDTGAPALTAPVGSADLVNLLISLAVVVAAVVLCGWLFRRTQSLRGAGGNVFRVVASQALGPRERVVVIEVGGKQLLLGMTASQVSTLHVFDEPVVSAAPRQPRASESGFGDRLKAIMRGSRPQ